MTALSPNLATAAMSSAAVPLRIRDERYERRRQRAYERVQALGLTRRWIAGQVGRSVRCVTEVLRGTDTGEPTLVLVEVLLAAVEAGKIEPQGRGRA